MALLAGLWLPVLVSAVLVFVVSSVIHMVLPWHKSDYRKLPDEEGLLRALGGQEPSRGVYMFPRAESMKEMGSEEMLEKFERGPVGFLTVMQSGPPAMGPRLVQWFLYSVLVAFCAG